MLDSKKIILILVSIVAIGITATFTNRAVRRSLANDNVIQYKEEANIRDNSEYYVANSTADRSLLNEAMNYDNKNYQAPLLYAKALHNERSYDKALNFYQRAIAIGPDSVDGYWFRSQCYASLKRYDRAIEDMTKCIKIDPSRYSHYFARARLYGNVNNELLAIKDYDEILNREDAKHPTYQNYSMVLNNKANSLMKLGKFYEALPLLNKVIVLDKNEDTFWGTRGELYYAVGDFDKSYNDFNRAIRIFEGNKDKSSCDDPSSYYHYRGLLHSRLGLVEAARVDLQKAVQMGSVRAAEPLHQIEQIIGKSLLENI